jgi:hypothetical protein
MICCTVNLLREIRTIFKILGENFLGKLPLGTAQRILKDIIRFYFGAGGRL